MAFSISFKSILSYLVADESVIEAELGIFSLIVLLLAIAVAVAGLIFCSTIPGLLALMIGGFIAFTAASIITLIISKHLLPKIISTMKEIKLAFQTRKVANQFQGDYEKLNASNQKMTCSFKVNLIQLINFFRNKSPNLDKKESGKVAVELTSSLLLSKAQNYPFNVYQYHRYKKDLFETTLENKNNFDNIYRGENESEIAENRANTVISKMVDKIKEHHDPITSGEEAIICANYEVREKVVGLDISKFLIFCFINNKKNSPQLTDFNLAEFTKLCNHTAISEGNNFCLSEEAKKEII